MMSAGPRMDLTWTSPNSSDAKAMCWLLARLPSCLPFLSFWLALLVLPVLLLACGSFWATYIHCEMTYCEHLAVTGSWRLLRTPNRIPTSCCDQVFIQSRVLRSPHCMRFKVPVWICQCRHSGINQWKHKSHTCACYTITKQGAGWFSLTKELLVVAFFFSNYVLFFGNRHSVTDDPWSASIDR